MSGFSTAHLLLNALVARGMRFVTAESCTAGLVSTTFAGESGASRALWGGIVCYSDDAKIRILGVDAGLLKKCGAVSRETALAMAAGARLMSGADLGVAVTGIAGPDGDGSAVPVGTVWIATALVGEETRAVMRYYEGDRITVCKAAAADALRDALVRIS